MKKANKARARKPKYPVLYAAIDVNLRGDPAPYLNKLEGDYDSNVAVDKRQLLADCDLADNLCVGESGRATVLYELRPIGTLVPTPEPPAVPVMVLKPL